MKRGTMNDTRTTTACYLYFLNIIRINSAIVQIHFALLLVQLPIFSFKYDYKIGHNELKSYIVKEYEKYRTTF